MTDVKGGGGSQDRDGDFDLDAFLLQAAEAAADELRMDADFNRSLQRIDLGVRSRIEALRAERRDEAVPAIAAGIEPEVGPVRVLAEFHLDIASSRSVPRMNALRLELVQAADDPKSAIYARVEALPEGAEAVVEWCSPEDDVGQQTTYTLVRIREGGRLAWASDDDAPLSIDAADAIDRLDVHIKLPEAEGGQLGRLVFRRTGGAPR